MKIKTFCLSFAALLIGAALVAQPRGQMRESSREMTVSARYMLVPAADNGQMARLTVTADGESLLGEPQTIRLASAADATYWIPIDLAERQGQKVKVTIAGGAPDDVRFADSIPMEYDEQYRPLYHFTPYFGWTNDPNGMVYHDGEWHLAFQSNPYGTTHSNMHWGNAVSRDLIHWENLPLIVAPDSLGAIFSGSSVVDKNNTSGFGKDAIVGIYTSAGRQQRQSIAWSNDRGRTFTKYEGNPVLSDPAHRDYRDPKVAWIDDKWVMSLATGEVITFYGSKDLKNWEKLSEFGRGIGSHAAVWECPDLLRMEYNGEEKWVLLVSINPGGPNGGSVTQYFIGDFDGTEFHADPLPYPLWIDWGVDNYAGVTFGNVEGRHVFMGWMSNWNYSNFVPTRYFRNAMTLPRELSLKHNGDHLFLASRPAAEVYAARKLATEPVDVKLKGKTLLGGLLEEFDGAYSIDMTLLPKGNGEYGFRLCNSLNEYVEFRFNPAEGTLTLDRAKSGKTDFSPRYITTPIVTPVPEARSYELELFVDKHSTELFINDGDVVFTNCVFPNEPYDSIEFFSDGKTLKIEDFVIYKMQ